MLLAASSLVNLAGRHATEILGVYSTMVDE
jgi:hypothetical protein